MPMARMNHVIGSLVLAYLGALLLLEIRCATVGAYEMVFSDDITADLTEGNIDVPGLIRQDWLLLPLAGSCGLAAKFNTPHKFATSSTVRGTLQTTFEYLTQDCTAEYNRDNNSCALLYAAFAVCLSLPLDARTSKRPWGYCSNYNFRVSYLWIPHTTTNATANTTGSSIISHRHLLSNSSSDWDTPPVCSGYGCGKLKDSTDPVALASIHKDDLTLSNLVARRSSRIGTESGRLDTSCDWRFSNLIPVAWDGIQNVLVAGEMLQSYDTTYSFVMQRDCNLVLYKKGADGKYEWNAKWATFSQYNDPFPHNCSLELQPNGNLVVRDPEGQPRWESGYTSSSLYTCALAVHGCGNVVVVDMTSGARIWSTHTGTRHT